MFVSVNDTQRELAIDDMMILSFAGLAFASIPRLGYQLMPSESQKPSRNCTPVFRGTAGPTPDLPRNFPWFFHTGTVRSHKCGRMTERLSLCSKPASNERADWRGSPGSPQFNRHSANKPEVDMICSSPKTTACSNRGQARAPMRSESHLDMTCRTLPCSVMIAQGSSNRSHPRPKKV